MDYFELGRRVASVIRMSTALNDSEKEGGARSEVVVQYS